MIKQNKPKNQYELVHQWCNGLIDNYTKNSITIKDDKLYYRSSLTAFIQKGTLFVKRFNYSGAFGNGYNSYDIISAFKNSKRHKNGYIVLSDIRTFVKIKTEEDKLNYAELSLVEEIKTSSSFTTSIIYKNKLKSNRTTNFNTYYLNIIDIPKEVEFILTKRQLNKLLSKKVNINGYVIDYIDWSDKNYYDYNITAKLKNLLNDTHSVILTKEELYELNFRIWRNYYLSKSKGRGFIYDYKTSREIYIEKERKEKIEKERKEKLEEERIKEQIEIYKHNASKEYSYKRKLVNWIKGINSTVYLYDNYSRFSFHYLTINQNAIRTSAGVSISIEEGEKLYKLVSRFTSPVNLLRLKYEVGGYYVKDIEYLKKVNYQKSTFDNLVEDDILCLRVGCHNIPIKHINWFVKRYFPQWM